MPKRVTERERLLGFAMTATSDQLEEAAAIIRTAQRTRFTTPKRSAAPRAASQSRRTSTKARQPASTETEKAIATTVGE